MSRLIDADVFEVVCFQGKSEEFCEGAKYILEMLDAQPTAYDVDEVIKQLEEETDCPNCSMYCADAHICGFDEMRKQAIDIVRRGGVE